MPTIDASELRALAADLTQAPQEAALAARKLVSRGALNIKRQLQAEMRESDYFKGAARSISYDLHGGSLFGVDVVEAEIGPTRGVPGSLANIAYFGTSRGGGTVPDPQGALDAEAPRFEKALADLLDDVL